MKVVGYINSYKTDKQDRTLDVKSQKEKIEDFCAKYKFELVKIYEEAAKSSDFKPVLMKLISDSASKTFEKVIVFKFDKLGQDEIARKWAFSELAKHNTGIYSATESSTISAADTEADPIIRQIRYKIRDIPSLPEVVTRVMELVQDPNSSAAQLSKVISHDTGLTSRVLRLVNSAYYGFPKQISSIQHAIMILGFTTIRGLVLSTSIFKIFTQKSDQIKVLDYKKLWKHSLIAALASKKVSKFLHFQEDSFSAAILHDIGKIILDQYDHENYLKVLQEAPYPMDNRSLLSEKRFCGITHPDLGYLVAEEWNLPAELTSVIHYHHYPLESVEHTHLSCVVYLGNIISHIILDFSGKFDIGLFDERILDFLGVNEDDLLEITSEILIETENIGDLESFLR